MHLGTNSRRTSAGTRRCVPAMDVASSPVTSHTVVETLRVPKQRFAKFAACSMARCWVTDLEPVMFATKTGMRLFALVMVVILNLTMSCTTAEKQLALMRQFAKFVVFVMARRWGTDLEPVMFATKTGMRLFALVMVVVLNLTMSCTTVERQPAPERQFAKFAACSMARHWGTDLGPIMFATKMVTHWCAPAIIAVTSPITNRTTVERQPAPKRRFVKFAVCVMARHWVTSLEPIMFVTRMVTHWFAPAIIAVTSPITSRTVVEMLRVPNKRLVKFAVQVMVMCSDISSEIDMFVTKTGMLQFVRAMDVVSSPIMNRITVEKLLARKCRFAKFAVCVMARRWVTSLEIDMFVTKTGMLQFVRAMDVVSSPVMSHTVVEMLRAPKRRFVKFAVCVMARRWVTSLEPIMFVTRMVTHWFAPAIIAVTSPITNRTTVERQPAPKQQFAKFAAFGMMRHWVTSLEPVMFATKTVTR